jgi:hypothetical protein
VRDGSDAEVAAGGHRLPGNDLAAAVKMRAVCPISVIAGVTSLPGSRAWRAGHEPGRDRATVGPAAVNPGPAWCYGAAGQAPPAWYEGRGTPGWKGASD